MDTLDTQVLTNEEANPEDSFENLMNAFDAFFEQSGELWDLFSIQLNEFAGDAEFSAKMGDIFGEDNDYSALQTAFSSGEFESFPKIEFLSGASLNGANAAYAAATNTIYFSEDFLHQYAGNLEVINSVLLEEFGHYVDAQINTTDTPGDEGEYFSNVVQGVSLSESQVQALQSDNDSVLVNWGENSFEIEQSDNVNWGGSSFEVEQSSNVQLTFSNQFNGYDALKNRVDLTGKTELFFVNGILTPYGSFEEARDGIGRHFKLTNDSDNSVSSEYSSLILGDGHHNTSITDVFNLNISFLQEVIKGAVINVMKPWDIVAKYVQGQNIIESYKSLLAEQIKTALYGTEFREILLQHFLDSPAPSLHESQPIKNKAESFLGEDENNSVIFFGHSQGNFFIEDTLQIMGDQSDKIKGIGIGSPTNYSNASSYDVNTISNPQDPVTYFANGRNLDNALYSFFYDIFYTLSAPIFGNPFQVTQLGLNGITAQSIASSYANGVVSAFRSMGDKLYNGIGGLIALAQYNFGGVLNAHSIDTYLEDYSDKLEKYLLEHLDDLQHQGYFFVKGKEKQGEGTDNQDDWLEDDSGTGAILNGGSRNDVLWGNSGNDILIGAQGYDFIDGGSDQDTADYSSSNTKSG